MQIILLINDFELEVFELTNSSTKQFTLSFSEAVNYLSQIKQTKKVFIVLDLTNEDLDIISTPKLYLWEKPAYQARRLEGLRQVGKDLAKLTWTNLASHRSNSERKEEVLLSSSVALSSSITDILYLIEKKQLNLKGIYSFNNLIAQVVYKPIAKKLKLSKKDALVLWLELDGQKSMQLFFNQRYLYFSRLVDKAKLAKDLAGEIKSTQDFILRRGFLSSLDNLKACLVSSDNSKQNSEDKVYITSLEALIKSRSQQVNLQDLVLEKLVSKKYPSFYITDYLKQKRRVEQLAAVIKLVAFLLAFYLIYLAGTTYLVTQENSSGLQAEVTNLHHKKAALLEELSGKVHAADLMASLEVYHKFNAQNQLNNSLIFPHKQLAEVLLNYPSIKIKALTWQRVVDINQLYLEVKLVLLQASKESLQDLNNEILSLTKGLEEKLQAKEIKLSSDTLTDKSIRGFTSKNLGNNQLKIEFGLDLLEELAYFD